MTRFYFERLNADKRYVFLTIEQYGWDTDESQQFVFNPDSKFTELDKTELTSGIQNFIFKSNSIYSISTVTWYPDSKILLMLRKEAI